MEWLPLGTVVGLFSTVIVMMWRRQNKFRDNECSHLQSDISDIFKYITDIKTDITALKVNIATVQGDIKRLESWDNRKGD